MNISDLKTDAMRREVYGELFQDIERISEKHGTLAEISIALNPLLSAYASALAPGDEIPILDYLQAHLGLNSQQRYEYAQLLRHKRKSNNNKLPAIEIPPKVLNANDLDLPPGITGDIAAWLYATAPRPQKIFAIAGALSAMGALKAHCVKSEKGFRTNLYLLLLAESGSGKDHALTSVSKLLTTCSRADLIAGQPVSDTGLLCSLEGNCGRRWIAWDEIGHALEHFTTNPSSCTALIIKLMLELYSSAGKKFYGREYSQRRTKEPRVDIEQPNLNILAATTPKRFSDAVSIRLVEDGFLPRWLIFSSNQFIPIQPCSETSVPFNLAANLNHQLPEDCIVHEDMGYSIDPRIIPYGHGVSEILMALSKFYDDKIQIAIRKGPRGATSLYARACEHVEKIALTISGDEITVEDVEWALLLVEALMSFSVNLLSEGLPQNIEEKNTLAVLNLIRSAEEGGISRSLLLRRRKNLKARELSAIIEKLIDSGEIYLETGKPPASPNILKSSLYKKSDNPH